MHKKKRKEKKKGLTYHYPQDCGKFTLYKKGHFDDKKPIAVLETRCKCWSDYRSGGHLELICEGERDEDNDEDRYDLSLEIHDKTLWHVYYVDFICGGPWTSLMGLFDTKEGAEIYARILFYQRNGEGGFFHNEERVELDVEFGVGDDDTSIPEYHGDDSFGDYLVIISHEFGFRSCHIHPLNPYHDWDQVGGFETEVKLPEESKKTPPHEDLDKKKEKKKLKHTHT